MSIFGIDLDQRKKSINAVSIAPPIVDDGAVEIDSNSIYPFSNTYTFDIDNIPTDEFELISTYRKVSLQIEVDEAIDEIVNEAIVIDSDGKCNITINLDDVELSDSIKDKIRDEFSHVLRLLNFKTLGQGLFKKWYIDGRVFYHKVLDDNKIKSGIVKLVPIDPLNIKLVREYTKSAGKDISLYDALNTNEYYIYSQVPYTSADYKNVHSINGLTVKKDSVTYVPSGLLSSDGKQVLSYLYKSIKVFNNLSLMEDSLVVYRVSRAPERRVFYVHVGNLPSKKADQYVKDVMNRFNKKVVYDVKTGSIDNRKKFQSIMEDYFLPRRESGAGPDVTTLPGATNLGELGDVTHFEKKLYKSLNVPLSRFNTESNNFNIGRTTEITRDEVKFARFINKLRVRFSVLFEDILKTQLILKRIITIDDWDRIVQDITYNYSEDNYFQELKELEILNDRLEAVTNINSSEVIGKYISHQTVRKEILKQSEHDIEEEDKLIDEELKSKRFDSLEDENNIDNNFGE